MDSKKILKIANDWLGTKFHYNGRIKKNENNSGGVDCIGLIMKIGEEVGAVSNGKNIICYDYLSYSRYPNNNEMKSFLDKYFIKINKIQATTGDLIYFNFENRLEHIAIISDKDKIIHCYTGAKMVVENKLDEYWRKKIIGYYRYNLCYCEERSDEAIPFVK